MLVFVPSDHTTDGCHMTLGAVLDAAAVYSPSFEMVYLTPSYNADTTSLARCDPVQSCAAEIE